MVVPRSVKLLLLAASALSSAPAIAEHAPQASAAATGKRVYTPADFARFVREDNARWGKLIKEAGIRGE